MIERPIYLESGGYKVILWQRDQQLLFLVAQNFCPQFTFILQNCLGEKRNAGKRNRFNYHYKLGRKLVLVVSSNCFWKVFALSLLSEYDTIL